MAYAELEKGPPAATDASVEAAALVPQSASASSSLSAQEAFEAGDAEASRAYHDAQGPPLEGGHATHACSVLGNAHAARFCASFGSGVGVGSVLVAAMHGAGDSLESELRFALGVGLSLGYAFSSAGGVYLRRRAEQDYLWQEYMRETWEWENYPCAGSPNVVGRAP